MAGREKKAFHISLHISMEKSIYLKDSCFKMLESQMSTNLTIKEVSGINVILIYISWYFKEKTDIHKILTLKFYRLNAIKLIIINFILHPLIGEGEQ